MPMFTRRHYEAIAERLGDMGDCQHRETLVRMLYEHAQKYEFGTHSSQELLVHRMHVMLVSSLTCKLANVFHEDNPKFDASRFAAAVASRMNETQGGDE